MQDCYDEDMMMRIKAEEDDERHEDEDKDDKDEEDDERQEVNEDVKRRPLSTSCADDSFTDSPWGTLHNPAQC